jgi:hypothetical protein
LNDPRIGNALTHSYLEMTRSRIYVDLLQLPKPFSGSAVGN